MSRLLPNLDRQRWCLIGIWTAFLLVNLGLLLFVDYSQYQGIESPPEGWRDPINRLYNDVIAMYAIPLTTMLAIGFSRGPTSHHRQSTNAIFVGALSASIIWNCVMFWQNAQMSVIHSLDIKSLAESLPILPGRLSFLVTPVLAFYFSSEQQ